MRRAAHKCIACAVSWLTKRADVSQSGSIAAELLFGLSCLLLMTACVATSQERILYHASGIQVGTITDVSTNEHVAPPVRNKHPIDLTPQEIRSLTVRLKCRGGAEL